jgi:hypothetical protein
VGTGNFIGYRGKGGLRTYQGLEGDEARSMAKFVMTRWSEDSTIARQSFVGARLLTGVDELLVPADARAHDGVWEGRLGVGVLEVVARCAGAAGVRRIRWNTAVAEAGSGERFCRPSGVIQRGKRGKLERRGRAFIGAGESDEMGKQLIELKRRINREETVSSEKFGPRWRTTSC